jgi:hypothetical protein
LGFSFRRCIPSLHDIWEKRLREGGEPLRGYKVHFREWKAEYFSAYSQPVLIPTKLVGNQLAFISVHYRSSPHMHQSTSVKAKNVAMGQMSTIASREKNFKNPLKTL